MRRQVISLVVALALAGCAGMGASTKGKKAVDGKTMIKCPKCGTEFTVEKGMDTYYKAREE